MIRYGTVVALVLALSIFGTGCKKKESTEDKERVFSAVTTYMNGLGVTEFQCAVDPDDSSYFICSGMAADKLVAIRCTETVCMPIEVTK